MDVRTLFTEHRRSVAIAAGTLLLISAAFAGLQLHGMGNSSSGGGQAFYSIDDGKTWFADDASRVPPFEKDGKQAVRAYVYRTADGTKFVNHLERFRPEAKKALEAAAKSDVGRTGPIDQSGVQSAYIGGREVKRPGDAKWVNAADFREAQKITSIKPPGGKTDPKPLEP